MRGKGEGSIYKDESNGLWTGYIELPPHDGQRRRKKIRRKDKKALIAEMQRQQQELRDRGDLPTTDQTVGQWFTYWVEHIAAAEVRPKTATNYRLFVNSHIIPTIGTVRLTRATPAHVRRVTERMVQVQGLAGSTALTAHRVMSAGFESAVRENRISRNPAKLTTAPRRNLPTTEVLTLDEGIQMLRHFGQDEAYGARWATAMLTGLRRGEVLGLEIGRVTDMLDVSWQLQRIIWAHGCGAKLSSGWPCKNSFGTSCPDRKLPIPTDYEYRHVEGGLFLTRPKSRKGWRVVPLVEPLRSLIHDHIDRNPPGANGLVFHRGGGRPMDPDVDSKLWVSALSTAGIGKHVRLHDLRHTAVDMLYLAGVPEDIIVEIVGHSSRSMTRAYKSRGNEERLRRAMTQMGVMFIPQADGRSEIAASAESSPRGLERAGGSRALPA